MARHSLVLFHQFADDVLVSGQIGPFSRLSNQSIGGTCAVRSQSELKPENLQTPSATFPDTVDAIAFRALALRASGIHIEPSHRATTLRFRIDGVSQQISEIPSARTPEVISRPKIPCNTDIAERRRPQDGKFSFEQSDRTVNVRVSTIPPESCEKMVRRLLDQSGSSIDPEQLGIPAESLKLLRTAINKPQGMILVTGPTGSGKTTTLYACLRHIRNPNLNIMTIEDPIEYRLEGINQSQVKPDIGYNFAKALRAFLR